METMMGRVTTPAKFENLGDVFELERGLRSPSQVRMVLVQEALVDTGATSLALPSKVINQLGLKKLSEKQAKSSQGIGTVSIFEAVRLTIMDRCMTVDVMEVPDGVPVLIGQIPLEMLDLVVDLQGRRLTGNPAHQGEQILELY